MKGKDEEKEPGLLKYDPGGLVGDAIRFIVDRDTRTRVLSDIRKLAAAAGMGLKEFFLSLFEFWAFIISTAVLSPMVVQYLGTTDDPIALKIFYPTFALFALFGALISAIKVRIYKKSVDDLSTCIQNRDELCENNKRTLLNLVRDSMVLIAGQDVSVETPTYQWLIESFLCKSCSGSNNPLKMISNILPDGVCMDMLTELITDHYKSASTASDYLCVIFADERTSFLEDSEFPGQIEYFRGFDRQEVPRDRITRIFSVPATFRKDDGLPDHRLNVDQRQRLLAFVWVNSVYGVDTKLHIFDPNQEGANDFFQTADYVLCIDPTNDQSKNRTVLYIAKPGDEKHCLKISGERIISELFRFEFYRRLTEGHGTRQSDRIYQVAEYKVGDLKSLLGLTDEQVEQTLTMLLEAINMRLKLSQSFWKQSDRDSQVIVDAVETRWNRWFSGE